MSSRSKDYDISYKVLLIGESGVGKTSLIKSYSKPNEAFTPSLLSTVGKCKFSCDSLQNQEP